MYHLFHSFYTLFNLTRHLVLSMFPNKKYLASFLLVILFTAKTFSQSGYIITTTGDTLHGEIKVLGFSSTGHDKLILQVDKEKTAYSSLEAVRYVIDGEMYETIKHNGQYKYMRKISTGYLSVYKFRPEDSYQYSGTLLVKADGDQMELPNIGYKRQMLQFLGDCEEVTKKLEEKQYKKTTFDSLVRDYNACIQAKTDQYQENILPKTDPETVRLITSLKEQATHLDPEKREEFLDLLQNIENRLNAGENIPGYLKGSLQSFSEEISELKINIEQLLNSL